MKLRLAFFLFVVLSCLSFGAAAPPDDGRIPDGAIVAADGSIFVPNSGLKFHAGNFDPVTEIYSLPPDASFEEGSAFLAMNTLAMALLDPLGQSGISLFQVKGLTLGRVAYDGGTTALWSVANTTTTKKFFVETGDGTHGVAPDWETIVGNDIASLSMTWTAQHKYTYAPASGVLNAWDLWVSSTPYATSSNAQVQLGTNFDGSTSGHYNANSGGQFFGINAPAGWSGDFVNLQNQGNPEFSVGIGGTVVANGLTLSGFGTGIAHVNSSGAFSSSSLVASEIPSLDASKITTGTMATARLGSGTADATTYLAGDQTYKTTPTLSTLGAVPTTRTVTIAGTTNQVSVTPTGAQDLSTDRTWTLSLPQSIHTGATPQFTGLNLSGLTASQPVVTDGSKNLASLSYNSFAANISSGIDAAALSTNKVALARGGTNADLSSTGPGFLKQATTGANVTVAAIASADLPNLGGDVDGTPNANTVRKIQGVSVNTTTPTNTQVLTYDSGTSKWGPANATTVPVGTAGQSLINVAGSWTANSNLQHDGTFLYGLHGTGTTGNNGIFRLGIDSGNFADATNRTISAIQFVQDKTRPMAQIVGLSTQAGSSSALGSELDFYTVPNSSSTLTLALRILNTQAATFSSTVTATKFIGATNDGMHILANAGAGAVSYTMVVTDFGVTGDTSAGSGVATVTLPSIASTVTSGYRTYQFASRTGGIANFNINRAGSDTFDGGGTGFTLTSGQTKIIWTDGTVWFTK
jgi:hypothetical protein